MGKGINHRHGDRFHRGELTRAKLALLCLAFVLLLVAVIGGGVAWAEQGEPTPSVFGPLTDMAIGPDAVPLDENIANLEAASEMPHRDLGREESLELAQGVFGTQLESAAGIFDDLQVAKFLSRYAAVIPPGAAPEPSGQVIGSDGEDPPSPDQPVLLESTLPLRVADDSGDPQTVDLDLERSDGELQPTAPLVPAEIPSELGEGLSLPSADVGISLVGAPDARSASLVGESYGFYPNVAENTDLIAAPTPLGLEVFTQIRTADAPRVQRFELDLPPGAELALTPEGGAEVTRGSDGILLIPPPSASDAAGNDVAMNLEVVGNDAIEVEVSPTEATVYPILADPSFLTEFGAWNNTAGLGAWTPSTVYQNYQPVPYMRWDPNQYPGLGLVSMPWVAGGWTPAGSHADWAYYVPRYFSDFQDIGERPESYISMLYAGGVFFQTYGNNADYPALVMGTWYESGSWQSYGVHYGGEGPMSYGNNEFYFYNQNESTGVRAAVIDLVTHVNENPTKWRDAYVAFASVGITDQNAPTIGMLGESEWVDQQPKPIAYKFSDNGLGVKRAVLIGPVKEPVEVIGNPPWHYWETSFGCSGTAQDPCPRRVQSSSQGTPPLNYDPAALPTGENTLFLEVLDPLETAGPNPQGSGLYSHFDVRMMPIYVDHINPVVQLSGSATAQGSLGPTAPSYTLHADATDGNQSVMQSGVHEVVVKLDGQVVSEKAPGCPSEKNCAISLDWALHPEDYAVGDHTITVSATDDVGRTTVKTLSIEIGHDTTSPTLSAPGEFFGSLSGWVEQETYEYEALAQDAGGYGVTSLVLKIDGQMIKSASQQCLSGGCSETLSGLIDMSAYEGGTHPAELIATDGVGNTKTRKWKINVNPKGQISSEEATATLEALDETADVNTVGESKEEDGLGGTAPDLGIEEVDGHLEATGTMVPTTIDSEPEAGMTMQILPADAFGTYCASEEEIESEESEEEAQEEGESEGENEGEAEPCLEPEEVEPDEDGYPGLDPIEVTPVQTAPIATENEVAGDSAIVAANTTSQVDTVVRPLYDGGMVFAAIRSDSAPEDYSWEVQLGKKQELKQLDDQHAMVYYKNGNPAFGIDARPARDAVGTAVPTKISIREGKIVTLTIEHRGVSPAGGSFVYPVVGGTGWEGGYQTFQTYLGEPQEQYWESDKLIVGPPESVGGGGGATASSTGEAKRPFVKVICGHSAFYANPGNESYTEECGNPFKKEPGYATPWQAAMRGMFLYKPGAWAEQQGVRACAGQGYDTSVAWHWGVKKAYECIYGPRTSDGNGGTKVGAGHYLRAQAHWEVGHYAKCRDEFGSHEIECPSPNPIIWEDKALELHLWPSGVVDRVIP